MEEKIDTADKKVLADIVKLAQKRGLKGKLGDWKEFLDSHDKKFGANLSDPSKRPHELLATFLKSFSKEEDLKFFDNIMRHHENQYMLERLKDKSHESPEQVRFSGDFSAKILFRFVVNFLSWIIVVIK
ncbi:small RNA degrading nuclease 3-like [Vigna umbellata]|uniref:small RNA degrading nuclease 3-like n=1 Tax=Vigna umbellata TaxID=87088 RepID=UPI001F5EEECD|nr:small RNA degrading nuclease 3-like [Vigna umbellata]